MRALVSAWRWLGPAPVTLAGLLVAFAARATGGSVCWRDGALDVHGAAARLFLRCCNPLLRIGAITLGHVIVYRDASCAARLAAHERVHVRQYERWGFLLPPLYALASALAVARGGRAWHDNVFEVEALRAEVRAQPAQSR